PPADISTLSLHDALPIWPPGDHERARRRRAAHQLRLRRRPLGVTVLAHLGPRAAVARRAARHQRAADDHQRLRRARPDALLAEEDRKSTRLNSSHLGISY